MLSAHMGTFYINTTLQEAEQADAAAEDGAGAEVDTLMAAASCLNDACTQVGERRRAWVWSTSILSLRKGRGRC